MLPVGNIGQPKYTTNLNGIGLVVITIWTNLPPVVWRYRRSIQIEPCGYQAACCGITVSRCHFSHISRCQVFIIIAGHIIWIKRRLTRSRLRCGDEEVFACNSFWFIDWQSLVFGTVFVLHILQKRLLILRRIWSLVIRIDIRSLVPLPEPLQLLKRIKDMCWNEKQTGYWIYFRILFG